MSSCAAAVLSQVIGHFQSGQAKKEVCLKRKESLTLDQRWRCVGASAGSENTRANSAVRMRTRRMAARSYVVSPGKSVSGAGNGGSLPATPERLVELNQ